MITMKSTSYTLILLFLPFLLSCDGLNLFSVDDDITLGEQLDQEIQSDSSTYPLLNESSYPEAYTYIRGIRDKILDSGEIDHLDDFEWKVSIIEDDTVLNAFAAPGGYLYFYSGLIKYLESEDHFAGVMAHEIAHADQRHSTEALTSEFGLSLLISLVLGNDQNLLVDVAHGLTSLQFSRTNEADADSYSVIYLSSTEYACNGAAGFFEKLIEEDLDGNTPEFLSTHPDPENRVEDINAEAVSVGCSTEESGNDYEAFKDMLP